MHETHLLSPGPTPVPEAARLRMARRQLHHRGPEFESIFGRVREGLEWLFQTESDVVTLTCSGTGAVEAAMANLAPDDGRLVAVGGGKFGERWGDVGRARGMDVVDVDVEWGTAVDPGRLGDVLASQDGVDIVTLTLSETSTGVLHPLAEVTEVVREQSEAMLVVDAITAVGVHSVPMDELGLDVVVGGSQKAFGVPPGLGLVAVGERAWSRAEETDPGSYYFDLIRERDRQRGNQTAFTPAVPQVLALDEVLGMMREESRGGIYRRHAVNAEATRAGVEALGLEVFGEPHSNAVTAVEVPESVEPDALVETMREREDAAIAGGQKHLSSEIVRLGHIGFFKRRDMLHLLGAFEASLAHLGVDVTPGAAVTAAQRVFEE